MSRAAAAMVTPDQRPIATSAIASPSPVADGWSAFPKESGTLGVPRAEMPQIKAEHRGALTRYANARGVTHQAETVPAASLKPTQAEFSAAKVKKAIEALKIEPVGKRGVCKLYAADVIEAVRKTLA